jgi:hypothetical protein
LVALRTAYLAACKTTCCTCLAWEASAVPAARC